MPAYNEAGSIRAAVEDVLREAPRLCGDRFEILAVNDGSRDSTGEILDAMARESDRVRPVHQPNGGHGAALLRGLREARGEFLLLIDADRQISLEAIHPFWEAAQRGECALGVRASRRDPAHRLALSWIIRSFLRLYFGVGLRDANCPFKIVGRELWERARPCIPDDTLAPSLFLAVFVAKSGFPFCEIEVPHRERTSGKGTLRAFRLLRFCAKAFGQLPLFKRKIAKMRSAG
jgi:glycosyltransferase involved in cell wall biosynthesis